MVAVVAVAIVAMPSKEEHYSRNDYQQDIPSDPKEIINSTEWERQLDSLNKYHKHQMGEQKEKAKDNVKYMTKDKSKEVIINFTDPKNPEIVTDPYNMGTYNFGTNVITHTFMDVIPYWLYGNSEEDSDMKYIWDRIFGAKG